MQTVNSAQYASNNEQSWTEREHVGSVQHCGEDSPEYSAIVGNDEEVEVEHMQMGRINHFERKKV